MKTPPLIIPYHKEPKGFTMPIINRGEYKGWRYGFESASVRFGISEPRWVRLGRISK